MSTKADEVTGDETANTDVVDETKDTKEDAPKAEPEKVEAGGDTDWKAEAEKWKELSRKNERSYIAAKDTLTQIKAENESLSKEVNEFADLKTEHLELKKGLIASKVGLPERLVSKLSGSTDEELEKDAKEMLEAIGSLNAPRKPQPLALQGLNDALNQPSSGETARQLVEKQIKQNKGL